jgi:hypothetical protein
MTNIKVIKNQEKPEPTEVLAEAIIRMGEAADKLKSSGLNETAIIVLLHDATKLPKRDIKLVLDSMRKLRSWYCRN